MEPFIITVAYLLIGLALRRVPAIPENAGAVLNQYVIFVALPALVLFRIPDLVFSSQLLVPVFMPWIMLTLSAGLVLAMSRMAGWDRATTGCLLLLVPLGNTSFLGIPMVTAFFGPQAVPYAVLYDQLGSFLALATYGTVILALYASGGVRPTTAGILSRVVTFPAFLALVVALALKGWAYPAPLANLLGTLAATLVPVVMVAVGFQLSLKLSRSDTSALGAGLGVKLIAAPLLALSLCKLAGVDSPPATVSVFEAGMPPMITAGALAVSANLAPRLSAALVGFGIVASFVTLPLLFRLLT